MSKHNELVPEPGIQLEEQSAVGRRPSAVASPAANHPTNQPSSHPPFTLSVVIPVFNEAPTLEPLHRQLTEVLTELGQSYELIFVDDGSTDGSGEVLEELYRHDPRMRVIQFRRNFGKTTALAAAFQAARGEIIITIDADLQYDPAEIPKLLAQLEEGYDLVCGRRYPRRDPLTKRLASKIYNGLTRLLTGVDLHDFNAGFKACRREAIRRLPLRGELHRYIPVLVALQGGRVCEVPVRLYERRFGESKFGTARLLKGLLDLFTVLFLTRFMSRPLHLFGTIGLLLFAPGFAIGLYLTSLWFRFGHIQERHPLLLLGILLMLVGMQFFSIGLIGEMLITVQGEALGHPIRRILEGQNERRSTPDPNAGSDTSGLGIPEPEVQDRHRGSDAQVLPPGG